MNSRTLAEGIQAGLIKPVFVPGKPREFEVVISTNGSGVKRTSITSRQTIAAWTWARGFARHTERTTGVRWDVQNVRESLRSTP